MDLIEKKEYSETINYVETTQPDIVAEYIESLNQKLAQKDKEIKLLRNVLDNIKGNKASDKLVNARNAVYALLERMVKETRHKVCEEIRSYIYKLSTYDGVRFDMDGIDLLEILDQIEGEN